MIKNLLFRKWLASCVNPIFFPFYLINKISQGQSLNNPSQCKKNAIKIINTVRLKYNKHLGNFRQG